MHTVSRRADHQGTGLTVTGWMRLQSWIYGDLGLGLAIGGHVAYGPWNRGTPGYHPFLNGIFHYKPAIFGDPHIYGNPDLY